MRSLASSGPIALGSTIKRSRCWSHARWPRLKNRKGGGTVGIFDLWHTLALDVTALDHIGTHQPSNDSITYDQYGPPKTSRALALFHITLFEMTNLFAPPNRHARSWMVANGGTLPAIPAGLPESIAVAGAAQGALLALYPHQSRLINDVLSKSLQLIQSGNPPLDARKLRTFLDYSEKFGRRIVDRRRALETARTKQLNAKHKPCEPRIPVGEDASWTADPKLPLFKPNTSPGKDGAFPPGQWTRDPVSASNLVLGASWGKLPSFTALNPADFSLPPPPALDKRHL